MCFSEFKPLKMSRKVIIQDEGILSNNTVLCMHQVPRWIDNVCLHNSQSYTANVIARESCNNRGAGCVAITAGMFAV